MKNLLWTLIALALAIVCPAQVMPRPALPFYEWKVCPGEGCQYGRWTARKAVAAYDTYKASRRLIARISKGDVVEGLTGVVITYRPGVIRLDRDRPEEGLHSGDEVLTYTYRGEGDSAAWSKGKFYSDFDIAAATSVDQGNKVWWAQVKFEDGCTAWVKMNDADFDGLCSLASPSLQPK